jgi:hypothetical protein
MYTDKDFIEANAALKKFVALYFVLAALLLVLYLYSMFTRIEWIGYVSALVLVLASLFLWGNFGGRLVCWRRFLHDMRQGLEREASGIIATVDDEVAQKEGLDFRVLRLLTGDETDKAGGRFLYVDTSRFPLPAGPGRKVRCMLFGNYIKEMTVLEEE